jgi:hypothetical protein
VKQVENVAKVSGGSPVSSEEICSLESEERDDLSVVQNITDRDFFANGTIKPPNGGGGAGDAQMEPDLRPDGRPSLVAPKSFDVCSLPL